MPYFLVNWLFLLLLVSIRNVVHANTSRKNNVFGRWSHRRGIVKAFRLNDGSQSRPIASSGTLFARGGGGGGGDTEDLTVPEKEESVVPSLVTVRLRVPDGSQRRLQIGSVNDLSTLTLADVLLASNLDATTDIVVSVAPSNNAITDHSQKLIELGVQNGSLLTVTSTKKPLVVKEKIQRKLTAKKEQRFDPFPDLAKDYDEAMRRAKLRRHSAASGMMSYSAIASLQSAMHTVEAQPLGKIQRVYMCQTSAARFRANRHSVGTSVQEKQPQRVALLLGTLARERKDAKPKARTSLSSTIESDQFCEAARVHAIWEPPPCNNRETSLLDNLALPPSVQRVANSLNLQVVGWIFTYQEDRSLDDGLPVFGREIQAGATLQINQMRRDTPKQEERSTKQDDQRESSNPARFVTLAMDDRSGATEAFQLSDVAVQMVAENMFAVHSEQQTDGKDLWGRYIHTRHPIVVDGKETQQLDSVLCLVNTALLGHVGMYAGSTSTTTSTKKNGSLTKKTVRTILKNIHQDNQEESNNNRLFKTLCDFNVLLALDEYLSTDESDQLCRLVQKWARGQKQTVNLTDHLEQRLKQAIDVIL